MGEILCFSARFFIYPNYTKEFENTYNKECLITKISSKNKGATIQKLSVNKGCLQVAKEKDTYKYTKYSTETRILALKIFSEKLKNSFLQTTTKKKIVLARCLLEWLPSLILLTLCNFCLCCVHCKIVELTFSKVHQH